MDKHLEFAKVMRGSVPEWDETYVKNISQVTFSKSWVDDKGYNWGFTKVFTRRLSRKVGPCEAGTPIAIMASKYMGMGCLGNII